MPIAGANDKVIDFKVVASLDDFFFSDKFIDLVIGPVGSTKTTAGIMRILYMASRMAPCADGVRRSRCAWIRNTREQLRDTSIRDFLQWFPDGEYGVFLKSEYSYTLRVGDVECEVLFRGLDDEKDVRRLLSLQLSFAVLDEFREINSAIFEALGGRCGRYPNKAMVPPRDAWGVDARGIPRGGCVDDTGAELARVWGMSNPPDADTFWEEYLSDPPANANVVFQPSGMAPEADWLDFLPSGYYDNLADGKGQDWIDVYIHAKFGRSLAGKPVFTSFNSQFHVSKGPLVPILNGMRPIIIGMDFGLTPSAVLMQQDLRGRVLVYDSIESAGMGVLRFCTTKLKPLLMERFAGAPTLIAGDPAGTQRVQTDERTVYEILREQGFKAVPAYTNSIVARVNAVETFLNRMVDGQPGFLIDPRCVGLVKAMRSRYRYRIKKDGEKEDQPEKNEASHVADALQYGCMLVDGPNSGKLMGRRRPVASVDARGWT